jgi:hypothetical protein
MNWKLSPSLLHGRPVFKLHERDLIFMDYVTEFHPLKEYANVLIFLYVTLCVIFSKGSNLEYEIKILTTLS